MRFKSSLIVFALSGACTQRVHSRVHTSRGDEVAMWGLKRVNAIAPPSTARTLTPPPITSTAPIGARRFCPANHQLRL